MVKTKCLYLRIYSQNVKLLIITTLRINSQIQARNFTTKKKF